MKNINVQQHKNEQYKNQIKFVLFDVFTQTKLHLIFEFLPNCAKRETTSKLEKYKLAAGMLFYP